MSRGMRMAVGLEPPERKQGQAAHDFEMAAGNTQVILASALRFVSSLSFDSCARSLHLRPETVSRGFKAVYGVTPAAYRLTARARAAFASIQRGELSLADIALSTGFADQAHMTRAVVALTGRAPGFWRRAGETTPPPS